MRYDHITRVIEANGKPAGGREGGGEEGVGAHRKAGSVVAGATRSQMARSIDAANDQPVVANAKAWGKGASDPGKQLSSLPLKHCLHPARLHPALTL